MFLFFVVLVGVILFFLVFNRLNELQGRLDEFEDWRRAVQREDAVRKAVTRETAAPEPPPMAPAPPAEILSRPAVVPPPPRPVVPPVLDEPAPEPASAARRALLQETALRRLGAPAAEAAPEAPASHEGRSAEEWIGGIWLQNVGSILLLLGVFFLILWGYTTGRFGAGVLVAAGVAFGGVIGWRGDVLTRRVPAFGHALIGIGLGAAYISLYLGHFALGVLSPLGTTVLLALTSIAGILVAQRYRVQLIAVLAVIGAFIPQVAAILTHSKGFVDAPPLLLLYLGAIDAVVFVLAARSRWPLLALLALLLSTGTWVSAVRQPYDWPVTFGLAAVFVGLGLAPVRRLARSGDELDALDAAVVVLAPYLFLVAAWPFLAAAPRAQVGALLAGLALVEGAAAAWARRASARADLWNILVTAGTVFLTGAVERLLGRTWTPMGWVVEGVVLTAIGVRFASRWLESLGGAATMLGLVVSLPALVGIGGSNAGPPLAASGPLLLFTANSVRALVVLAALFTGSRIVDRERREGDVLPAAWIALAELTLFLWLGVHAARLAAVFLPGSGIPGLPGPTGDPEAAAADALPRQVLMLAILALTSSLQGFAAIVRGVRQRAPHVRALGYAVALAAFGAFVLGNLQAALSGLWRPSDGAFIHPAGLFEIQTLLVVLLGATVARKYRGRLDEGERQLPEFLTAGLALLTWLWIGSEAAHAAHFIARPQPEAESLLAASMIAFAWAVQAAFSLVLGVRRGQFHRRAIGYVAAGTAALAFLAAVAQGMLGAGPTGTPVRNVGVAFQVATLVLAQVGAARFGRARDGLTGGERHLPPAVSVLVAGLTWAWLGVEAMRLATLLRPHSLTADVLLGLALVALAWTLQAAASLALGVARNVFYRRLIGYAIALSAALAFLAALFAGWTMAVDDVATRNLAAGVFVTTLALWLAGATVFAHFRGRLPDSERDETPEGIAFVFNALLMLWTAQHLSFLARALGTFDARRATAVLTSAAWVVQAAALFLVGWRRRSPFLRWLGLGLFGITLGKVALFDLAFVDVFWRFLIAIFFGAVLLAISYVYQRSRLGGRKDRLPS